MSFSTKLKKNLLTVHFCYVKVYKFVYQKCTFLYNKSNC